MSSSTLPRGVDCHGAGYRGRVRGFPNEVFETVDEAEDYVRECRRRKRAGILVPPARTTLKPTTLAEAALEHLTKLERRGGKRRRPYSADALADARKAHRPWTGEPMPPRKHRGGLMMAPPAVDEGGRPFAELPLTALQVRSIERYLEARSEQTQRAAVGEQQALVNTLRLARHRGETFDPLLLELEPLARRKVKRKGPALAELRYLAAYAPEWLRRLFLLGGTLGGRIGELLQAEDGWVDDERLRLTIPVWACKERREKVLDLLPEEHQLIVEQRLVRSPDTVCGRGGTRLLFPRKRGTRWNLHGGFYDDVVVPARRKAARAWREEHGLAADAPTPFEWVVLDEHGEPVLEVDGRPKIGGFAPHDLRRGAADLLRELGISPELAAARLGHKDAGWLLVTTYADSRPERLREELDQLAAEGGIDARLARRQRARQRARARQNAVAS